MAKHVPYSRRELRALRNRWLRSRGTAVGYVVVGVVIMMAVTTTVGMVALRGPLRWYVMGVGHAVAIAAGLHLLHLSFLASDRTAIHQVRGAWGEENTSTELQRARRRRLVWGVVDSIGLQIGDIDHLVVTRRGGVIAIDSKWRNTITAADNLEMARSARRSALRAEGALRQVFKKSWGHHRGRGTADDVTPIVVIWGAAQQQVPDDAEIEGVRFVRGRHLVEWLAGLDGEPIPKQIARGTLSGLRSFRASTSRAS